MDRLIAFAMQKPLKPAFCFSSSDPRATARALYAAVVEAVGEAARVRLDNREHALAEPDALLAKDPAELVWEWRPSGARVDYTRGGRVYVQWPTAPPAVAELAALLGRIPFTWMSSMIISRQWGSAGQEVEYYPPSFWQGHYDHGWVAAFKGEGHDQLVSRRWLAYGPWRLIQGDGDLSLVQFHDLEADDAEALEQARPGHRFMGIAPEGGFIPPPPIEWKHEALRRLYDPKARVLTVLTHGRQVGDAELLEACAIRRYQPLEVTVDNLAFIYMREADARDMLHALWLRGLECRALIKGVETRLDADYEPPPQQPRAWVERLRDRDGF